MAETSISGIEFKIVGSTTRARSSVDKLVSSLKGLKTALNSARTAKLEKELEGIDKNAKKSTTTLGKLFKSIGRIGFYRAIRAALRFITDGFKEGLQNAYQFSKMVGYELAGTMDTLATKSLTMKNQLGSAFGGLIMAVEPILLQLIALVTRAANAIAQLMAIIGGKSTYLKAIDTVKEYGAAVGGAGQAAKEAMRYLAPFDELNVLPSDNGGGGGGGASTPDYSAMFEETPVAQALQDFAADFKITVSDVLFDWSDLTGEQIAEKALSGLFMLTGAGVGFILGGVPGALIGSLIGLGLSLIADTFIFDHDGVLEPNEIAHGLQYVLNALAGGTIGFLIGGPGGALIGASIGLGLSLLTDAFDFKAGSENKVSNWLDRLTAAMTTIGGAVIGFMIGGPAGALIGASIGLGINLVLEALKPKAEREDSGFLDELTSAMETMTGGAIGFFVGGPLGALIGMSLSFGLHLILKGSIVSWIKENVIKPMVDTYNGFVEEHPKVAQFLGLEPIEFNNGPSGHADSSARSVKIDVEADVTSVKDSVPVAQKTFNGFTGSINKTDTANLTEAQKTIPTTADFNSPKNSLTGKNKPSIPTTANLNEPKNSLTGKNKPSIASDANITGYQNGITKKSGKAPVLSSTANITSYSNKIPKSSGKAPLLSSTADLTSYKNSISKSSGKAPNLASTANVTDWTNSINGTPVIDTKAKITSTFVDPLLATPTIDVNARITGSLGNPTMATGGAYYGNSWHGIPQAASGGKFHGTLFWAGESGAEVVGHAGGRTEVLNRSQLAATMYAAVHSAMSGVSFQLSGMRTPESVDGGYDEEMMYRAMLRALNDSDVADSEITLDGDVLYRKMVQRNQMNTRMTGRNVMATA